MFQDFSPTAQVTAAAAAVSPLQLYKISNLLKLRKTKTRRLVFNRERIQTIGSNREKYSEDLRR
jgi:hypothetical protein